VFDLARRLRADHVRFNIELKRHPERPHESPDPDVFVRAVLAVIHAQGMGARSSLQSFDWSLLRIAQRAAPGMALAFLSAQRPRFNNLESGTWSAGARLADFSDAPAMVAAAGGKLWSPHFQDLSQRVLERARAEGLRVIPWTVNDIPDMERLIDWGVDGLITDHPERLRDVLLQRGIVLPPPVLPLTARRSGTTG
jgi:glycerophosphoryl diester phosphodiesterase